VADASPQPELERGAENEEAPQSEETGREEEEPASMSSMLTLGLGADGTGGGGRAFLVGFAPGGGGGGAAITGGTGRGGRTRGWLVFSGREGKRPAAMSAAMASRSSARVCWLTPPVNTSKAAWMGLWSDLKRRWGLGVGGWELGVEVLGMMLCVLGFELWF